jgi:hypothetical protein
MTSFSLSTALAPDRVTHDRRVQVRTGVLVAITLIHDSIELAECRALNISNKGVYIELPCELSVSMGSPINLRFHIWTGRDHMSRFLRVAAVRCGGRFLAARIVDNDWSANAVLQDILYFQQLERSNADRPMGKRLSFSDNFNSWVARLVS